jgi:hypothetical protein
MTLSQPCRFLFAAALCTLAQAGCHSAAVGGSGSKGGAAGNGDGGWSRDGEIIPLNVGDGGGKSQLGPGQKAAYACRQKSFPQQYACTGDSGTWAEALQKALWFFHANELGNVQTCTYNQWRGPAHQHDARIPLSHVDPNSSSGSGNGVDMSDAFISANRAVLDPDGDGTIDVSGGFHDAGDFIKFGLTSAFSASTMAWSWLEFPEAYQITGLEDELRVLLKLFGDYFMRSTFRDPSGRVIAFAHQVGGANDHTCGWMPPELRRPSFCPRTAYFSTDEKPAADVTASAAAALAQISQVFKDPDPAYASQCLDYAQSLYQLAAKYPDSKSSDSGGLYDSEYSYDDLAWAALNLYEATGNEQYLRDTFDGSGNTYTGWIKSFGSGGFAAGNWGVAWSEGWTHCWNSLRSGVFLKMAVALRDKQAKGTLPANWANIAKGFKDIAYADSDKWTNGQVTQSPARFSVLAAYGSGRYNSAGQFIALVYNKYFAEPDFVTWATSQMNYLLGANPLGTSYVMGYSDKYAKQPHHAASHASIYGECGNPVDNRHIAWGALINGPDGNDNHVDSRCDFGANEITIDYNASMLAALAGLYVANGKGQCPLRNFPPVEPDIDEFYTRTRVNSDTACTSQIEITMMNESIHPPRYDTHLSARYYFDIGERNPPKPGEIQASLIYDRGAQEFSQPTQISGVKYCGNDENGNPTSTYYVELSWEGYEFWGEMVKLHAPPTLILQLGVTNGQGCVWDASNDWSHTNLNSTSSKTQYVPVYSSGELIFGKQPPCQGKGQQEVVQIIE